MLNERQAGEVRGGYARKCCMRALKKLPLRSRRPRRVLGRIMGVAGADWVEVFGESS